MCHPLILTNEALGRQWVPWHIPGAVICVVRREKPFPGAGTFAENADGQPVFLAEAVPPSPSPREKG